MQMICPTCDNSELEIWEIRKYKAIVGDSIVAPFEGKALIAALNPDEHNITHIYCDECDPAHGNNLAYKLNELEIDVQFP